MKVEWNRSQTGFLPEWLWSFGEGPFEVLEIYPVTHNGTIGYGSDQRTMDYESGEWYTIKLDNPCEHWKELFIDKVTFFHNKWFKKVTL